MATLSAATISCCLLTVTPILAQGSQRPPTAFAADSTSGVEIEGNWPHFTAVWRNSGTVFASHSHDGGVVWSAPDSFGPTDSDPKISRDGSDVIVLWSVSPAGGNLGLRTRTSQDDGVTWSPPLVQPATRISDPANASTVDFDVVACGGTYFVAWRSGTSIFFDEAPTGTGVWGNDQLLGGGISVSIAAAVSTTARVGVSWLAGGQPQFRGKAIGAAGFSSQASIGGVGLFAYSIDLEAYAFGPSGGVGFGLLAQVNLFPGSAADYFDESNWATSLRLAGSAQAGSLFAGPSVSLKRSSNASNQRLHAFFVLSTPSFNVLHRTIDPLAGAAGLGALNALSNVITNQGSMSPSVRGSVDPQVAFGSSSFGSDDIVACTWSARLPGNPSTSSEADPCYNLSMDGGSSWLAQPASLNPGPQPQSFGGVSRGRVAVSGSSVVSIRRTGPSAGSQQGWLQSLVSYGVSSVAQTSLPDDPLLSGLGLTVQGSSPNTVSFVVKTNQQTQQCPPVLFGNITLVAITDNSPPPIALGPCSVIYPVGGPFLYGGVTSDLVPAKFAVPIPVGPPSLVGASLNAQAFFIGLPGTCGSNNCVFASGVTQSRTVNFVVSIL